MNRMEKFLTILLALLFILAIFFLGWVSISGFDIALHNLDPNPTYMPYNFFICFSS